MSAALVLSTALAALSLALQPTRPPWGVASRPASRTPPLACNFETFEIKVAVQLEDGGELEVLRVLAFARRAQRVERLAARESLGGVSVRLAMAGVLRSLASPDRTPETARVHACTRREGSR